MTTRLRVALKAQAMGFDGFFRSDHLIAGEGDGLPGPTDTWATLAALSRETETIRLGSLMTSATFRHPRHLAITVVQVDQMSNGRVGFGFGAGWWAKEHRATGIPFGDAQERFDRFEEQLQIINGLWTAASGESFSFAGEHYVLVASPALPKPVQPGGIPVIIGGGGKRRTPALAARWATEFNSGWDEPATTNVTFERVREACRAIGRDPGALRLSTVQTLCAGETPDIRDERAAPIGSPLEEISGLTGDGNDLRQHVAAFASVGVDRLYVEILDLDDLDHIEFFAHEVIDRM